MFSAATKSKQVFSAANYIEDVFSTYLYTGTGSSQTITNNIDTTTYGGLVWIKGRSGATGHRFTDTARGTTKSLASNSTAAQATESTGLTAFGTTGFTIGADADYNTNTDTYASWTFRKQAKFFDVVTYTGASGNAVQNIAHNLGSVPGCIIVKCIDQPGYNWVVYHRSTGATQYTYLNTTAAAGTSSIFWNDTAPTSTQFTVGTSGAVNGDAQQYVAYLFAHDAGGFGLTGTDNVISCGSFATNSSGQMTAPVNLGYEPQYLLIKNTTSAQDWFVMDTMRGFSMTDFAGLRPNTSQAEFTNGAQGFFPTATGFDSVPVTAANSTYIYIAIRRGPMKTPTSGTSVFAPVAQTSRDTVTTNFPVDLVMSNNRIGSGTEVIDRLRGDSTSFYNSLMTYSTASESTGTGYGLGLDNNTGYVENYWTPGQSIVFWNFRRAPGFFDEVCYTGTGSTTTFNHNLGVVPELMIIKGRSNTYSWKVYNVIAGPTKAMNLNTNDISDNTTVWASTSPTSSVFTVGSSAQVNESGSTYVAYLFASCPGVSKVGSYTGTGTTKQIDCGFTGGARFVLIKRTDSTGDWYVWDSARGIVAGNDPYLLLNSTAAEVTNTDYVDTYNAGFEISSTAPAAINANGGSFIFLAIA